MDTRTDRLMLMTESIKACHTPFHLPFASYAIHCTCMRAAQDNPYLCYLIIRQMKITVKLLCALLCVALLSGCHTNSQKNKVTAQSPIDTGLIKSVKSMHEDLAILWSAIQEMHPGYGIYTDSDSMQDLYKKTYAAIQTPLTESQFITAIYPFVCGLRCGHTQIKHSEGFKPPVTPQTAQLPFKVLARDHRAWITTHRTDQLDTGDEIISVNNVPVKTIIDHGYDLYGDDGYNETFKELFLSEYDGFEDVCNRYYHWQAHYQLKLLTASGTVKTVQIQESKLVTPAISPAQIVDNYADWITEKSIPDSRLRFLDNASVALLQSPPFAYADTVVFKDAFKLIQQKRTKTLILDMRQNSGGDIRVATQLLSYLADAPFRIVKDVKSRLPNPALNSFARYFDTSITQGFLSGFRPDHKEGAWYHITSKPAFGNLYGPFALEKANHFDGKLIVLIGGATFSSGTLLTAALKAQRKGVIFIGRETAGSEEGCNGVTLQKLTLPNTKIVVDFPWMRVISMAKNALPGRGIMPDYPVNYSPNDIVTQNDLDLKKALSIMN